MFRPPWKKWKPWKLIAKNYLLLAFQVIGRFSTTWEKFWNKKIIHLHNFITLAKWELEGEKVRINLPSYVIDDSCMLWYVEMNEIHGNMEVVNVAKCAWVGRVCV